MNSLTEKKFKVSFNSPVILAFTVICLAALILDYVTRGAANDMFFSVYRSSLASPFTYIRFFGHVAGHAGWEHFIGNIMLILIVGPLLEEKYGSANILFVILSTALVTGLVNFIFFPSIHLLGASGVVFALILLSSFTSIKEGDIPLTFILVAVIYIGEQIYKGIFIQDNVANLTHIIGAVVGAALGFIMNKNKMNRY
ncbi:MAG: rhomboid family intramembrane serine protease [Firmicutes bacterium]|nr:rhomboid family intramembrane serine protease [Bacillota bacterium]